MIRSLSFILGLVMLVAGPTLASIPRQYAILLGNSDYNQDGIIEPTAIDPGDAMPDLKSPCDDTKNVLAALNKYDFNIIDRCNLTKNEFDSALGNFKKSISQLPKGSVVIIYYSGHGMQYAGDVYSVPVGYNPRNAPRDRLSEPKKHSYLNRELVQVSGILKEINNNPGVYIAVFIDSCRSIAFQGYTGFNEDVTPHGNSNQYIVYSTNGGNTAKDDQIFSTIVARSIARGGDIRTVVGNVLYHDYLAFRPRSRARQTKTYAADVYEGADFKYGAGAKLSRASAVAAPPPTAPLTQTPIGKGQPSSPSSKSVEVISSKYARGMTLDIFYCEGPDQAQRYAFARAMAASVDEQAAEFGVGSIRLKFLPEAINREPGYRVTTNLVRYDQFYLREGRKVPTIEREIGLKVAFGFPNASFLLSPGIGVNGHPTENYLSAFVCGPVREAGSPG